jgi:tRNA pseudouridine38-40 synthase
LAYDGGAFRGWQRQPGLPTVQQAVEDALADALAERVQVHGAARTDAGVHAEGQVASFALRREPPAGDVLARRLPESVRIGALAPARPSFHARASAAGKRYRSCFAAGSPVACAGCRTWPGSPRPRAGPDRRPRSTTGPWTPPPDGSS